METFKTGDGLVLWYDAPVKERKKVISSFVALMMLDLKNSFFEDVVKNRKTYLEEALLANDNLSQSEISCELRRMY